MNYFTRETPCRGVSTASNNMPNTVETVFFTVSQKYKGVRNRLGCGIEDTTVSFRTRDECVPQTQGGQS